MVSSSCSTTSTVLPRSRKLLERATAVVVARVQSDGRFIQNIEHAAQPRADLCGQANALRFAAGKRAAERSRLRYPRPTAIRKLRRAPISSSTRAAISFWRGVSFLKISSTAGRASLIGEINEF